MAADRTHVLSVLAELAPLELAESWDNVGLLVDPSRAGRAPSFTRAFLTIDLTADTLDEARAEGAELIVAYHPPIFGGLKRLRHSVLAERLILEAVQQGITIYSPHTALDAARGGMGDWLAGACGPGEVRPIAPFAADPGLGAGRLVTLSEALTLSVALERIKEHLGLLQLRVASPDPALSIRTLAVCPGAGGALFQVVPKADLFLTGEMRHHDILARLASGSAVVLTDHTNCERGYLPLFAERLRQACPGLAVAVSRRDADPLGIV